MFQNIITAEFVERFMDLNGERADVHIKHILYGPQKIKGCNLHPLMDEERIGLVINDEDVYIMMDELCEVSIDKKECCLKGNVMEITLKIQ